MTPTDRVDSTREIKLPCFGIVVTTDGKGGGVITSELNEGISTKWCDEDVLEFECNMDGITSMILAHACAGIDIESPAYLEGIESAVEACANDR